MSLDTITLFVAYIICSLTIMGLLMGSYREERPRSVAFWIAWLGLHTLGIMFYAGRGKLPDYISIILANMCITGGQSFALAAFQTFFSRPLRPALLLLPVGLAALITSVFFNMPDLRIPLISVLLGGQGLLLALVVLRHRKSADLTSLLVATPFALNGLLLLTRMFTIGMGFESGYTLLASSTMQTITLLLLLVTLLASSFGFVLMHRERTETDIKTMALHDALTGCLNRRSFQYIMDKELARLGRGAAQLSLLLADIDHFKLVNDTYGHAAGDAVLVDLVHKAERVLRTQDFIFRYGGEEFCILLPRSGRADALAIAERIRQTIETGEVNYAGQHIRYTVSIGCTCSAGTQEDQRERMFLEADRAMYAAKQAGRNQVRHFDDLNEDVGKERQTS